jgi:hypothetical protein
VFDERSATVPVSIDVATIAAATDIYTEAGTGDASFVIDERSATVPVSIDVATIAAATDIYTEAGTGDASFVIDERSATVPVSIDVATIAAATDIYTEAGTGDALGATITFCIRFGLNTLGGTPTEVNFLESVVTMDVDLGDGFSIANINVTPKDQLINTASQDYTVTGFLCTPGTGLIVGDPAAAFNQGALVTVCVEPDATGKADGIKMRTIDDFTWTRDSTTQEAIAASAASTNSLTSFNPATCAGGDYCEFSSILFAAFYATTGSVAGSGTVTMQFGPTRRRLQEGRALRTLQDEIAASSPIDLNVNLAAADDGPSALQTAAGASMGTMCAAVVASIGAIALL